MMVPHKALVLIALSIQIRDNAHTLSDAQLLTLIKDVAEFGVLSNRQISKLCDYRLKPATINKIAPKPNKTGGAINAKDLEKLRQIIFSKSSTTPDFNLIKEVVRNGTSQGMVSRITGVSQSTISRKIYNGPVL